MKQAKPSQPNNKPYRYILLVLPLFLLSGCLKYSFTGSSIPEGVNSIYIPFFADQSSGSVANLSDRLNQVIIDRFINQSSLQLADDRGSADAVLEGAIVSYNNAPFSITGEEESAKNEVQISVRGTYRYTDKKEAEWNKTFSGSATYDTQANPIEGEANAAQEALEQIANNMFNDAVSGW